MQVAALKDGDAQDGDAVWTAKVVAAHAVWPPAEGPEPALRSRMAQDAQAEPQAVRHPTRATLHATLHAILRMHMSMHADSRTPPTIR